MKKFARIILVSLILFMGWYGASRLYFHFTGGFQVSNITSDKPFDEHWVVKALQPVQQEIVDTALSQSYRYLGKGCQSYVFASEDGKYVIKFIKYQRFRPKFWVEAFAFIPQVQSYLQKNIEKKQRKLERIYQSWKTAFNDLQDETGIIYVHLNKSQDLKRTLIIYDKLGVKHELNLDDIEFMIQRRATMLCPTIAKLVKEGNEQQAKELLSKLVDTIVSEYRRGFADHDHALMQNTGVIEGNPVHIDVGQFAYEEEVKASERYEQELFSKTYKFRIWLNKNYPMLEEHLKEKLIAVIGPRFHQMKPNLKSIVNIE